MFQKISTRYNFSLSRLMLGMSFQAKPDFDGIVFLQKTYGAGTLHSKTQRFSEGLGNSREGPMPGPGKFRSNASMQLR
jgi:hypothetical protein